ncbi:MAG: hypothetical protein DWH91_10665 [Planctomycetota bacterium]|nr:MAG: hypothetical protein DWH91_10665 [Planctomycetota bacterium]
MSPLPRAPQFDGDILRYPPGDGTELVATNEAALAIGELFGRPLAEIRQSARLELSQQAATWTSLLRGTPVDTPQAPCWIVGGHQPDLFHPGVWIKNAVISQLSRKLAAVPLNLVVNTDLSTTSSIPLPSRDARSAPQNLAWDHPRAAVPWEERITPDRELFRSFGDRCQTALQAWGWTPLAAEMDWERFDDWPVVDRLAGIRHRWEVTHGIENLELKSSTWADSISFRWFAWQLLSRAGEFHTAYNRALCEYREENRLRSRSHPVPPLETVGNAVEVPLWVWRSGERHRSRLFVETIAGRLRLTDGARVVGELPLPNVTAQRSIEDSWYKLEAAGWKLRPRALMTTLAMRMCVASVFVHGIGGAKYDQMTDRIIISFFHRQPPQIIVATATERLFESFAGPPIAEPMIALKAKLRQFRWNPERLLESRSDAADLLARKRQLIAAKGDNPLDRTVRHERLQVINSQLRARLVPDVAEWTAQLEELTNRRPRDQSLRSREYSSVLFPAERIVQLFQRVR